MGIAAISTTFVGLVSKFVRVIQGTPNNVASYEENLKIYGKNTQSMVDKSLIKCISGYDKSYCKMN